MECLLPLGTLVTLATVYTLYRLDTGEGEFQGQPLAMSHYIDFVQLAEGGDDSEARVVDSFSDGSGEVLEELRRGIGERIGAEDAEDQLLDAIQMAPEQAFEGEEQVATGQVDCFVGGIGIGDVLTGGAPVLAIEIAGGLVEDDERL